MEIVIAIATDGDPLVKGAARRLITLLWTLAGLAAQTELLDQLAVAVIVFRLQVVKQLATLVYHLQKTLTAVVIFLVLAEVIGKLCNSF